MRINTNGEKDYRTELYKRTAERFGVGTKSGGIDAACEFSTQMLRNLERTAEHDDMTKTSPNCFRPTASRPELLSTDYR